MSETAFDTENIKTVVTHPNWGAIWSGVFTFFAIWSVFGVLGTAIFASIANPNAANPVSGMSLGISIWSIVLTIIAMYVAGRVTGHLAGIGNLRDGVVHGIVMFGLSIAAVAVLITMEQGVPGAAAPGSAHSSYILGLFANIGWAGFVALFLGWLAAMGGASTGTRNAVIRTVRETRRAA